MSNSGSTYKDSFTIRYDNPTDTNRDTSLFELGSDNPNRAIPFPIGSFLGTGENATPFLLGDVINFTCYFNTGNKIITTARISPVNGDETAIFIYDLRTGIWQGGTTLGAGTDVVCKPVVIPKLPFTNPTTGETGFYEGLVNVVELPPAVGGGFNIQMSYLEPDDFTTMSSQILVPQGVFPNLTNTNPKPNLLYDVDLDMLFILTNQGSEISVVENVRANADIGIGVAPVRTTQTFTTNWVGSNFDPFGQNAQFKLVKTQSVDTVNNINGVYQITVLKLDPATPVSNVGRFTLSATLEALTGNVIFGFSPSPQIFTNNAFMTNTKFCDMLYIPEKQQMLYTFCGVDLGQNKARILVFEVAPNGLQTQRANIELTCGANFENCIGAFQLEYDSPRDKVFCIGYSDDSIGLGVFNESYMILDIPSNDSFTSFNLTNEDVVIFKSNTASVGVQPYDSEYNIEFTDNDSALAVRSITGLVPQISLATIRTDDATYTFAKQSVDGTNNYDVELTTPYPPNTGFNNFSLPNNGSLYFGAVKTSNNIPSLYFNSASGSATANGVIVGETSNQTYLEVENSQIGSMLDVQSIRVNIVASASEVDKQNQVLTPLIFAHQDSNGNDIEYAKVPTIDPYQAQFVIPEMRTGSDSSQYILDGNTRLDYNIKKQTTVDVTFNYSKIKNLLDDTRRGLEELQVRQLDLEEYNKKIDEDLDVTNVELNPENINLRPSNRVKKGENIKRKRRTNGKRKRKLSKQIQN